MHPSTPAIFLVALSFALGSGASAQDELDLQPADDVVTLSPVVVTATRGAQAAQNVPNTVTVVDSEQIRKNLPRSFPEVFDDTPSVMVQKTGHGQGSPFIRGFTGFRNLLMIDGIRLNHAAMREGPNQYWATVDPYTIDSMELIR